jgi:hypothetical protein
MHNGPSSSRVRHNDMKLVVVDPTRDIHGEHEFQSFKSIRGWAAWDGDDHRQSVIGTPNMRAALGERLMMVLSSEVWLVCPRDWRDRGVEGNIVLGADCFADRFFGPTMIGLPR